MMNDFESVIPLDRSKFMSTVNQKPVDLFTLKEGKNFHLAITNYGGRIVSLLVPDRSGELTDVVLGFESIDGYLNAQEKYYGATIGRYANRIAFGRFTLDGRDYRLSTNLGEHHLHGGPDGFHNVVWDAKQLDERNLLLQYISRDGKEGFPGRLNVKLLYGLMDGNALRMEFFAVTDKKTVVNFTNHAFFNLHGAGSGTVTDHQLMINADRFTPVDSEQIPTGELASVQNTPFDFRSPASISSRLDQEDTQLAVAGGFDHNYVLKKEQRDELTHAATASSNKTGIVLEVMTTEPGIQFYGGQFLDGSDRGKNGAVYRKHSAFCLETQHFPDSPNHPNFPSTVLKPGELFHSITIYQFGTTGQ